MAISYVGQQGGNQHSGKECPRLTAHVQGWTYLALGLHFGQKAAHPHSPVQVPPEGAFSIAAQPAFPLKRAIRCGVPKELPKRA